MYKRIEPLAPQRRLLVCTAVLGAVALMTGCGTPMGKDAIAKFETPVQLADAPVMPSKKQLEMGDRRVRVVVFQPEDNASVRGFQLPQIAVRELESQLGKTVEIVDRTLANSLDKELKLAEMNTSKGYLGPDVADYAVKLVMGVATWGSRYDHGSSYVDKKTGKTVVTARPGWTYEGTSKLTVRIYEIPSLRMTESLELEGRATLTEQPYDLGRNQAPGLTQTATQKAVESKREELRNEFAPRGYITAAKTDGKSSIFKITIGKRAGVKPGNPVEIYSIRQGDVDLRTNKASTEEVLIGQGIVSEQVGETDAWISLKDDKSAAKIKRGDYVKVSFDTSILGKTLGRFNSN